MATKKIPEPYIIIPLTKGSRRLPGLNNFTVEGIHKQDDNLKITISFTLSDGQKIPRDAGPSKIKAKAKK